MAGLSIVENKYEGYKHDANEVVHFKLCRTQEDFFSKESFHPDMTHQLFGDSESIFGYKDLEVQIFCSAASLSTYINVKFSDVLKVVKEDDVPPDDVNTILAKEFQAGFLTSKDDFLKKIDLDAKFKPFGELITSYKISKDGKEKEYQIYKADMTIPGFKDYHERMQPFLLFYVDAASYIDVDDDKWSYYVIYEKYKADGINMFAYVGYSTIYNYYAYPARTRPRISQVLIMPPFQKQGHGAKLIQTFYEECYKRHDIKDITVEDPSEGFQRVRDFIDVKNCSKLKSFAPDELKKGFSEDMIHDARHKLHINKKQARRVYEILRLKATSFTDPEESRAYRLDIKRRINVPFQKNGRDFEKLHRALSGTELSAAMNNLTNEQRMEYLQKTYEECVTDYRHILERVAIASD